VASFGLSGAAARAVNRLTFAKRLGGKFAFQWGVLKALFRYRSQDVRIQVDDVFDEVVNITAAAVCNGQYFGSAMHIAPDAKPDDGLLDVLILENAGFIGTLRLVGLSYRGEHLSNPRVTALKGRKVTALPVNGAKDVLLDVDGEAPGRLPATFEILPNALYLRC